MQRSSASSFIGTLTRAFVVCAAVAVAATRAQADSFLLADIDSGKVLDAHNATVPWYPASLTKIMTTYLTLRAVKEGRITFDTLLTVSPNAVAQQPVKMGFPVGTRVTVDNALKMLLVKSANDMAVVLAEGVGGSIEKFSDMMNENAKRLGMTQSSFVNPNGLPADGQIMSARDIAILVRAVKREFPEYDYLWHLPGIRYGKKVVRNYNPLLGRYQGTDGMKTGFICASGFNLVATATRGGKRLVAVVLGAPSGAARALKAAQLLEEGFSPNPLSWLVPSQGTVDQLVPVSGPPPDLHDEMCGPHRKHAPAEDEDSTVSASLASNPAYAAFLSNLRVPASKAASLLQDANLGEPVVVYTGPTRKPGEVIPEPVTRTVHAKAKPKPKAKATAKSTSKPEKPRKKVAAQSSAPKKQKSASRQKITQKSSQKSSKTE